MCLPERRSRSSSPAAAGRRESRTPSWTTASDSEFRSVLLGSSASARSPPYPPVFQAVDAALPTSSRPSNSVLDGLRAARSSPDRAADRQRVAGRRCTSTDAPDVRGVGAHLEMKSTSSQVNRSPSSVLTNFGPDGPTSSSMIRSMDCLRLAPGRAPVAGERRPVEPVLGDQLFEHPPPAAAPLRFARPLDCVGDQPFDVLVAQHLRREGEGPVPLIGDPVGMAGSATMSTICAAVPRVCPMLDDRGCRRSCPR